MMKRLIILFVLLAFAVSAQANILTNGGFELDTNIDAFYWADDWNAWNWAGGWSGWVNNNPLSDGFSAPSAFTAYEDDAYGYAGGWGGNSAGITFDFTSPVVGQEYIASVMYSTEDWGGDNQAALRVKWWGDYGEVSNVYTIIDAAGPMSTWELFSVNVGAVPFGTTGGQFELEAGNNVADDGGTVLFDNASLSVVPEPMTIGLLGLGGLFLRRRKA